MDKNRMNTPGSPTMAADRPLMLFKEKLPSLQNSLSRELAKGKLRRMSLTEQLLLKHAGRTDGAAGLPKQTESGAWESAVLRREIDAYSEYCDNIWGDLQITLQETYAACDTLIDKIMNLNKQIALGPPPNTPKDLPEFHVRKHGEESLSESQVCARRRREADAKLAHKREEYKRMRNEVQKHYEALSELHSHILESNGAAGMVCERVLNHSKQRTNVYWRSAWRVHPDNGRMPAAIDLDFPNRAEESYRSRHARFEETVTELLAFYEKTRKEENTNEIKEVTKQ